MSVSDKVCLNWYWDQIMAIENEEKSAYNCLFCHSSLLWVFDEKSNSTDSCCLSYLVLDRVDQLKTMHDKCKEKSGLTSKFATIITSGDAAIWLTSKGRNRAQQKCTIQSASEDKCNRNATHGQSLHSVLFYLLLLILMISLNILQFD